MLIMFSTIRAIHCGMKKLTVKIGIVLALLPLNLMGAPLRVLIPIPTNDFDPTEVAISWSILNQGGVEVHFATPNGEVGSADSRMLTGKDLGILKSNMMASKAARDSYAQLINDSFFRNPHSYASIRVDDFDALILPGGHAKGMKLYLESDILQTFVVKFFDSNKPIGAICHGVVLAARSISPKTGKSVLHGRRTTALPKWMELMAWNLTRLWLGDYYRTYTHLTVEGEVSSALKDKTDFIMGPLSLNRDSLNNLDRGFVVKDGNYLSARWPGDAHLFGKTLLEMIQLKNSRD